MAPIRAVVFDLDGLLVDTESVFSSINNKILAKHDKSLTFELEQKLMGTKSCEAVRILLSSTGLEDQFTPEEYLSAFQAELNVELPNVKEMPGATKLIDYFHSINLPIGICTGSNEEEFAAKTKNFQNWLDIIQFKVLGSDVDHGKPAPDPYIESFKRLNQSSISPENVLVFEDALNGCVSAIEAGMSCVLVSDRIDNLRQNQHEQLIRIESKLCGIIPTLDKFNPSDYGLPLLTG